MAVHPSRNYIERKQMRQTTGDEVFDEKVMEQWEEVRPQLSDFVDDYGFETISEDQEYLERRRRDLGPKSQTSRKLEYMVMDGIYSRNWLGQDTEVVPASEYDDVAHGVDVVVRFDRGEDQEPLYLLIDVTTSADGDVLEDKIVRHVDRLQRGQLAKVKYYRSDEDDRRGIVTAPLAIIGTNGERTRQLFDNFRMALRESDRMTGIDHHPVQHELLRQIQNQMVLGLERILDAYLRAAERKRASSGMPADPRLHELGRLLSDAAALELKEEASSPEWKAFIEKLHEHRATILAREPYLGQAVFQHLDLLEQLQVVAKEKRSQTIVVEGAQNKTEKTLEVPNKARITELAASVSSEGTVDEPRAAGVFP